MEIESTHRLISLPSRRKGGYQGSFRCTKIVSNHFFVKLPTQFDYIYIFRLKIVPEVPHDNKQLRMQLIAEVELPMRAALSNPVVSGANVFTALAPSQETFQFRAGTHSIELKQVKVIEVKDKPYMLLSFLNNGLRNMMQKLNYAQIGRTGKYFNVSEKTVIDGLTMFSGYKSNFVLLQNGFYLRVDSAKKIVRNQTVLQAIDEIYRMNQDKAKEERRHALQQNLVGKTVMTNYGRTAYYLIEEVVFDEIDSVHFSQDDHNKTMDCSVDGGGTEVKSVSIREYYEQKYQIVIKNSKQPLLKVKSKRKNEKGILLVPELCLMTGIPDSFDEFRRKKISEQTIRDPSEKQREINKLMTELKSTPHFSSLRGIGITISPEMEHLNARQIPIPRLALGEDNRVEEGKQAFFNLYNKPIYSSKHSVRCGLIYFSGVETRAVLDTFESTSRNLKVKLDVVKLNAGDIDTRKAVSQIEVMIKKAVHEDCNICCIIIPNNMKSQYRKIKIAGLIEYKILTQIITEGTLRRKNLQSIATKVLLQILAKRGNTLWVPKVNSAVKDVMLVGLEQAKHSNGKFGLSLCATINSTFTSHFSKTLPYEGSEAKFPCISALLTAATDAYVGRNKSPPKEIILFMGSVSNDQVSLYQQFALLPFKDHLGKVYSELAPALTAIMINVKTSERFFTEGQARNVPAGTLISEQIVSSNYDFYMVSQGSNRGSNVPNHYKVIHTDSKMEEGHLQELIFGQCFNYVNWTGSIKVPAILQYAQRCARFNSEVLEDQIISKDLENKLYFI